MHIAEDRYITPEEYLALEAQSPVKHEYLGGRIYAMTGTSQRHNVIALNAAVALRQHLRGRPCQVFINDVRLRVGGKANAFYYPDVMVVCRPRFGDITAGNAVTLDDPLFIIEVLSPGTEATDRREKLHAYRHITSLEEYVLVSQERQQVEIYRREHDLRTHLCCEPGDTVEFASVGLSLPIAALYEGTDVTA